MKKSILTIFLSIVFGFSNLSQQIQNGQWFWDNYFARQIHRLFDFPSNPGEQYQTTGKTISYQNLDK